MITPLSEREAREIISENRLGRLGCVYRGGPYVIPINYVFEDDKAYVHSLPGRKLEALRENPRVCLQVDEITDQYHWRSAILFGRYRELTDRAELEHASRALLARFPHLTPVESVPVHDGQSSVVLFCIDVEGVTGVGEK